VAAVTIMAPAAAVPTISVAPSTWAEVHRAASRGVSWVPAIRKNDPAPNSNPKCCTLRPYRSCMTNGDPAT